MALIVEDFVPYDRSSIWRLHDSYFAQCGAGAWTKGFIPYLATSNYAMARQHARMLVSLVGELTQSGALAADQEVRVLEVGSGLGRFAAHFSRALAADCGEPGRALRERLVYVLSDYSRKNVSDAIAVSPLAEMARLRRLTPALFDIANPTELRDLDGRDIAGPFTAVFANYVCCVLPPRVLRKRDGVVAEKLVRVGIKEPDDAAVDSKPAQELWADLLAEPTRPGLMDTVRLAYSWQPLPAGAAFADRFHQAVLEDLTASFDQATVVYPAVFLDFMRAVGDRLLPGGALFITDFGTSDAGALRGLAEAAPTVYGNTLNHGVSFALFDSFCRKAGLSMLRTKSPLLSVHRAAIRYRGTCTPAFEAAFKRAHLRDGGGQGVLDLRAAAGALGKAGDHKGAVRLYRRCLPLDPDAADLCLHLGEACFEAGLDLLAIRYLRRGRRLDVRKLYDFDFPLGRAYFRLGRYAGARRAFARAIKHHPQAAAHVNMGLAYENLGQPKRARGCYRRSLALAPDADTAANARRLLCDSFLRPKTPPAGSG